MDQLFITFRNELHRINIPQLVEPTNINLLIFPEGQKRLVALLQGIQVNTETGEEYSVDGVIAACDRLAKACQSGTLDDIRKARKAYEKARGQSQGVEMKEENTSEPVSPSPSESLPDKINPTDVAISSFSAEEIAEMERCTCPSLGCPVHKTENPGEEK